MNKLDLYILWFICLLCSSCGPHREPQELLTLDSLASVAPDSTLHLLQQMKDEIPSYPRSAQMYYQLLCIKAADKAYVTHTSDSLILSILDYYTRHPSTGHLAEAYYYAGRIYRDLQDAPQALDYFHRAEEEMNKIPNTPLITKLYSQIGTLYAYQSLYDKALCYYKADLERSQQLPDSVSIYYAWRDMGNMYQSLHKLDSTMYCFKQAEKIAELMHRKDFLNMIWSQMAVNHLTLHQEEMAAAYLKKAWNHIEEVNKSAFYSIALRLYAQSGERDSVFHYANQILNFGTVYAKKTAYINLLELALNNKEYDSIDKYVNGYTQTIDSIQQISDVAAIRKYNALYNYQMREKELMDVKLTLVKQKRLVIWLVMLVLLILVSLLAYLQFIRRRNAEVRRQLDMLKLFEKESNKQEELKRLMATTQAQTTYGKKLELLHHLMKEEALKSEIRTEERERFLQSALYSALKERSNSPRGEGYVTDDEWRELHLRLRAIYPKFFERLAQLHQMSEIEIHVCTLIKMEYKQAEIARLLNRTPEAISSIRRRLYKKVTGSDGTPDSWNRIIYSL